MTHYDVFNGDADGLCALQQLRLAQPCESVLVTGPKREIDLLRRVQAGAGDSVTVLDVSLDSNREALMQTLAAGAQVQYFDHHFPGEIPLHPALESHIDPSPETCTSLLVDAHLGGAKRIWAVVGAFGDNFHDAARKAAEPLGLSSEQMAELEALGACLNYNGYGTALEDLWFHPADLARELRGYADPFAFMAESAAWRRLRDGYRSDMEQAEAQSPVLEEDKAAVYLLPDEAWVRRVSGEYGNLLARRAPERAHAVLTVHPTGGYRVSVRAPLTTRRGADELCRQFPSGGGRQAAAGINQLPAELYEDFVSRFRAAFA